MRKRDVLEVAKRARAAQGMAAKVTDPERKSHWLAIGDQHYKMLVHISYASQAIEKGVTRAPGWRVAR